MSGKAPRNFCFTLNNYTPDEESNMRKCAEHFRYIVFGQENQGTPHLQGYAECKDQMRFTALKRILGDRVHIESRKGTPKQAAGYCKKGLCEHHTDWEAPCEFCSGFNKDYEYFFHRSMDDPETWVGAFEHGTISTQGKRSDVTAPTEMIKDGATLRSVAQAFPEQFVKFNKGFRDLRNILMEPRSLSQNPEVIVLHGPTGTGKTRDAYTKYWPDEPHYVWRPSNGNWWDGYDGEKKIIIDEFRAQMTWSDILGLLDRNEFRAPIKGGFTQIQADKFVITSPFPPPFGYREDDRYDRVSQLERRLTQVIKYTEVAV